MAMKKKIFGQKMRAEKIVITLSLNQNRKTEKVIIGEQTKVISWLAHVGTADFYYDAERPLGTFLLEHETQQTEEWNLKAGSLLMMVMSGLIRRKENEDAAWAYLEEKLKMQNAVCRFTTYQCWHWYGEHCGSWDRKRRGESIAIRC